MFPCRSCIATKPKQPWLFPEKKGGDKNPLSPEEKTYYSEVLGNMYQIGKQLGRSGQGTSAYLLTDKNGTQFVLKIPNNPQKSDEWFAQQKFATKQRDAYVGDYKGPIFIPKTIRLEQNFSIEELASGHELSPKVYDTLSPKQKKQLVKDFANFLNYSHQRTFQGNGVAFNTTWNKPAFEEIFNYFAETMNPTDKKEFQNYYHRFNTPTQEPLVLAYCDYRSQNMLWDSEKQQLSIIDFDCTRGKSVYAEFTPFAASSYGSSYQFLHDVILCYNRLPKQHPIHIDPRQVEANCVMGIYHERGRCGINRSISPEYQMRQLRPLIKSIKTVFNLQAKRKTYENT